MNYNFGNSFNLIDYLKSNKKMLFFLVPVIILVILLILVLSGTFKKVKNIETKIDNKIIYIGKEEKVKVKLDTIGNFEPIVKFRSQNGNFEVKESSQTGKEVETKIIAKDSGKDALIIEAGRKNKLNKLERVELLICERPRILNTGDMILTLVEKTKTRLKFNIDDVCLEGYNISVENKEIADIDSSNVINAKKEGKTTLVLKSDNDTIKYTLYVKTKDTYVSGIKINSNSFGLAIGQRKELSVSILPVEATNKEVKFESSDNRVATVSETGVVKGIGTGVAAISVISKEDSSKKAVIDVRVYKLDGDGPIVDITNIKFENNNYEVPLNQKIEAIVGVAPSNASNKTITCKSNNTKIATVTYNGNVCVIEGIEIGTTTVEAYSIDGSKKATTNVKVLPIAVREISFDSNTYDMIAGESEDLIVNFLPENASNTNVRCSSSNTSIATVKSEESSCVVTAISGGSVTITAVSEDGNKTAELDLKVSGDLVYGISFGASSYTVDEAKTKTLPVTIKPESALDKGYTCTSSNSAIAEVTTGCTVKGLKPGTVTITATAKENGQKATTKLTVKETIHRETIKVATYNIGYFGCGTSKKVHCKATQSQITNMFKEYAVDLVGIQEGVPADSVIKVGKNAGMSYYYKTQPANVNIILSKYPIKSTKTTKLVSCHENRSLDRAIININGVDISFYNTHYSYQKGCPATHMKDAARIMANDPNPIILTGDTNTSAITNYETYLKPLGFEIAAYDGIVHGYCDSVFILSKGHIEIVNRETANVYGIYSDHNMAVATLNIY